MKYLLCIFISILASCGHQSPVLTGARPVAAPKQSARIQADRASAGAARIEKGAEEIRVSAGGAQASVASAIKSANTARDLADMKNSALLSALDDVIRELEKARNGQTGLMAQIDSHRIEIKYLRNELTTVTGQADAANNELAALRPAFAQNTAALKDALQGLTTVTRERDSAVTTAANAKVYKWWLIGLIVIVIGLAAFAIFLRTASRTINPISI